MLEFVVFCLPHPLHRNDEDRRFYFEESARALVFGWRRWASSEFEILSMTRQFLCLQDSFVKSLAKFFSAAPLHQQAETTIALQVQSN
jgi:hypothetical protein